MPDSKAAALEALALLSRPKIEPRAEEMSRERRMRELLTFFAQKELRASA